MPTITLTYYLETFFHAEIHGCMGIQAENSSFNNFSRWSWEFSKCQMLKFTGQSTTEESVTQKKNSRDMKMSPTRLQLSTDEHRCVKIT